jgi:hypothetical protein
MSGKNYLLFYCPISARDNIAIHTTRKGLHVVGLSLYNWLPVGNICILSLIYVVQYHTDYVYVL